MKYFDKGRKAIEKAGEAIDAAREKFAGYSLQIARYGYQIGQLEKRVKGYETTLNEYQSKLDSARARAKEALQQGNEILYKVQERSHTRIKSTRDAFEKANSAAIATSKYRIKLFTEQVDALESKKAELKYRTSAVSAKKDFSELAADSAGHEKVLSGLGKAEDSLDEAFPESAIAFDELLPEPEITLDGPLNGNGSNGAVSDAELDLLEELINDAIAELPETTAEADAAGKLPQRTAPTKPAKHNYDWPPLFNGEINFPLELAKLDRALDEVESKPRVDDLIIKSMRERDGRMEVTAELLFRGGSRERLIYFL